MTGLSPTLYNMDVLPLGQTLPHTHLQEVTCGFELQVVSTYPQTSYLVALLIAFTLTVISKYLSFIPTGIIRVTVYVYCYCTLSVLGRFCWPYHFSIY